MEAIGVSDPGFQVTDELASFIGDLHDSEINGEISWFYDGVWGAKIGDRLNGYTAEGTFNSFPQAMRWLRDKALELYPDSEFAKDYRRAHPDYEPRPAEPSDAPWPGIVVEQEVPPSPGSGPPAPRPSAPRRRR
jgi:hypothetical protein